MNWDRIEGQWKQAIGHAKERWGLLTADDVNVVAGRRDQLAGRIQSRYGLALHDADKQIAERQRRASDAWFSTDATKASQTHWSPK